MVLKPGQKEAVEVPPGWCLQLCTAALEPAKAGVQVRTRLLLLLYLHYMPFETY